MTESRTTPSGAVAEAAPDLFTPLTLGSLELPNRVVMAPLTRRRATADGVPTALMARYYADRASAGLVVAEGTYPSERGKTYLGQPGIVTDAHVAGWRAVTDAVHARGGRIVLQIMHGGRVVHLPDADARDVVAPSPVPVEGLLRLPGAEPRPFVTPRELRTDEMADVVAEFVAAARRAVDAGFDGVELHGANGYLLNQFLAPMTNLRTDAYGGSPEARARLVVEVVRAVAGAVGAERTGLRISPRQARSGLDDTRAPDVLETYGALVDGIADLGTAYLSILTDHPDSALVQELRARFAGPVLLIDGFDAVTTREAATAYLSTDLADAVVVGRPVLANPDLVRRWREGRPLNAPDPKTFYGGDERGYTDYPFLTD